MVPSRLVPLRFGSQSSRSRRPPNPRRAHPEPVPGSSPTREGDEGDATSPTNVQEPDVDEPDLVKARGSRVFAAAADSLHAVEADDTPRLIDSVKLDGFDHELLLSGDRLIVVSDAYSGEQPPARRSSSPIGPVGRPVTILTELDVSNPAALRVIRVERIGGVYLSARLTGSTARVIVSSVARGLDQPGFRTRLRGWVPRSTLASKRSGKARTRRLSECDSVRRSRTYSGLDTLTVLTIDMRKGLPAVDADALMTGAEIVYASPQRLYVATQRWTPEPEGPRDPPPETSTAIHAFDTSDPGKTSYVGSGEVPGYLLNQFALSERDGVLRAASTEMPAWWAGATERESESFVSTLKSRDGRLVGLGRLSGLGRGEQIYAVRFIDDVGYVVTFRQTDPLYTIDLSRPATPRVLGEARDRGLLRVPAPPGPRSALERRPRCHRRGKHPWRAGLALRRLEPEPAAQTPPANDGFKQFVHGRVRPSCLPVVGAGQTRRPAGAELFVS